MTADETDRLRAAVAAGRTALAAIEGPGRRRYLAELGDDLALLAAQTKDAALADEAVRTREAALDAVPEQDDTERVTYLDGLATVLGVAYEVGDDPALLARSVEVQRAAVRAAPDDARRENLRTSLRDLWDHRPDAALLEEAVALGRILPATTESRADLCLDLVKLFDMTGREELLPEAVAAGREALGAPPDDGMRTWALFAQGQALMRLYQRRPDPATLAEFTKVSREWVTATADDPDGHAQAQTAYATALVRVHERTGDPDAARTALETAQAAAAHPTDDAFLRAWALDALGSARFRMFIAADDPDELRAAVTAQNEALALAAGKDILRAQVLTNLGLALMTLYGRLGDLDVLRQAVAVARESVAATRVAVVERHLVLGHLSGMLQLLARRTGDLATVREAITVARAAVAVTTAAHSDRAVCLLRLGDALDLLYDRTMVPATGREVIAVRRAAVAALPDEHPAAGFVRAGLCSALARHARRTGDAAALAESIAVGRAAVAALRPGTSAADLAEHHLASALVTDYERGGDRTRLDEALRGYERVLASPDAPVADWSIAGRALAVAALTAGDPGKALAAIERVVEVVPRLASRDLRSSDRAHRLGELAGTPSIAARAAIAAGRPERAVELLEQSRGVLLTEETSAAGEIARLRRTDPELGAAAERLFADLARLDGADAATAFDAAEDRRVARERWDGLLRRVRDRPGLAGFLLPPSIGTLASAAEDGPVVMVTALGDALVLTGGSVRHVPLPDAPEHEVIARTNAFLRARRRAQDPTEPLRARRAAQTTVHRTLEWLWDAIAAPILDDLGYTAPPTGRWPRVWWSPVGSLSSLPLHAAGYHGDVVDGTPQPRTVLDRVVSSYTPSVEALLHARRPVPDTAPRALIVAVPDLPATPPLDGIRAEIADLARLLGDADVLDGPAATGRALLDALPAHPVVHLACHGISDWTSPFEGRLLLHGHAMTVAALRGRQLPDARLAFLSACETSDAAPRMLDEAIHLTGAFQLAGYRHVVGTLWPVNDGAAHQIATDVYDRLTGHGTRPPDVGATALALHHAVRRRRVHDGRLRAPTQWAAHLHTGA
ncbi:CHAT domain-containing protein [Actinomadura rayongensis]|uniref:CHAT domain-containing protein n=1 Tax=Actinomadura rayongensis TaxID=1429076 RepID=A0A6I4WCD8_9ACTN|nr:CHAT domain-containing protein [Actinomadura rayongensis]MXQ67867.1 CHAT domain-containing protein [Actinomadura rayongensis]